MVHILVNKQSEFYWLSVAKRGGSFAVIGRSSESYSQKHNCEKSVKAEGNTFNSTGFFVIDHTKKSKPKAQGYYLQDDKFYKSSDNPVFPEDQSEIEFVQKLKK